MYSFGRFIRISSTRLIELTRASHVLMLPLRRLSCPRAIKLWHFPFLLTLDREAVPNEGPTTQKRWKSMSGWLSDDFSLEMLRGYHALARFKSARETGANHPQVLDQALHGALYEVCPEDSHWAYER